VYVPKPFIFLVLVYFTALLVTASRRKVANGRVIGERRIAKDFGRKRQRSNRDTVLEIAGRA
jgi:hypothetical protein